MGSMQMEPGLKSKLEYYSSYHNLPKAIELRRIKPKTAAHLAYLQCLEREKVSPTPVGILRHGSQPETVVSVPFSFIGDRLAHALSEGMKFSTSLERLNLRGNRLSRDSTSRIMKRLRPATIKDIDMSGNRLGDKGIDRLMSVLELSSLSSLHLEGCQLSPSALQSLLKSATLSKSLKSLNLARNQLGEPAGKLLGNFLMYSNSLKTLDLHWNCIRASGATELFKGLKENSRLEELDVSWNVMDSHDCYGLAGTVANTLELDDHLRHLDLSFNYLSKEQCTVIAKGLAENHSLLGLHVLGNYATVDARGFLQPADVCQTEESNYFRRILSGKKPSNQNCWLCDQWVEVELHYQGLATPPIFLHLEIDGFQPELMEQHKGLYALKRVLPAGSQRMFFSSGGEVQISGAYTAAHVHTPKTHYVTLWPGNTQPIVVEALQIATVHGKPCKADQHTDAEPRALHVYTPPTILKEKVPWGLPISLFKPYRFDTEAHLTDCFEFDWSSSRLPKLLKDPAQSAGVKAVLRDAYTHM